MPRLRRPRWSPLGPARRSPARADDPKPLKVLFLGDNGHHRPAERFRQLEPVLAKRGIELTYTDKADDLNAEDARPSTTA